MAKIVIHLIQLSLSIKNAESEKQTIFRPAGNTLKLTEFENSDPRERYKGLEVSWSYEADKVNSAYRTDTNRTPSRAGIRFRLKTFNHDGYILFGISKDGTFGGPDMVLIKHGCLR